MTELSSWPDEQAGKKEIIEMTTAKCICILTPTRPEMNPIARELGLVRKKDRYEGFVHGVAVYAAVLGMGPQRACDGVTAIIEQYQPTRILFAGFAGSLANELEVGDLLSPATVINEQGQQCSVDGTMTEIIVSVDRIIENPADKKQLAEQTSASAVDMESFFAAQAAHTKDTPLAIARAISDTSKEVLPAWTGHCLDAQGDLRIARILGLLITGPWRLGTLIRLGKASSLAGDSLAYWVAAKISQWTQQ